MKQSPLEALIATRAALENARNLLRTANLTPEEVAQIIVVVRECKDQLYAIEKILK